MARGSRETSFTLNTGSVATPVQSPMAVDIESIECKINNEKVSWYDFASIWQKNKVVAKNWEMSMSGKVNDSDVAIAFLQALAWSNTIGEEINNNTLTITFPDASVLTLPCVVELGKVFGGDSNGLDEFDIVFSGSDAGEPSLA